VKRFFGMTAVLVGLVFVLVGLGAVGYLGMGALGRLFGGGAGDSVGTVLGAALSNIVVITLGLVMTAAALLTVAERKWSALLQNRIGANRIKVFGRFSLGGIPYVLADALKMLTKERVEPTGNTRFIYQLAPVLAFAPVFALVAVVPIGPPIAASSIPLLTGAKELAFQIADPDVGLLFIFAFASLAVYGTALAGWASNNKMALLGGVRASSQMISYEVSLGLGLVGCMIAYETLGLQGIVAAQRPGLLGPIPALGILLQPIGFLVFFTSAFAETKRAPFDLPEGESEIVGYFVEYSGMKFGLMFLSEFVEIVVLSGIVTAVFLGGWHFYFYESWLAQHHPFWFAAIGAGAFLVKMIVLMWLQLVIRWLLPRFRYDQVQKLCWKILLPTALANVFVTGAAVLLDPSLRLLAWIGLAEIVVIGVVTAAAGRAGTAEGHSGATHAEPVSGH